MITHQSLTVIIATLGGIVATLSAISRLETHQRFIRGMLCFILGIFAIILINSILVTTINSAFPVGTCLSWIFNNRYSVCSGIYLKTYTPVQKSGYLTHANYEYSYLGEIGGGCLFASVIDYEKGVTNYLCMNGMNTHQSKVLPTVVVD